MLSKVRLERIFTWGQILLQDKNFRFTKTDADTLKDIAKELKEIGHQNYLKQKYDIHSKQKEQMVS